MIENIKGIVINIRDYNDNDQILAFYSDKYGVISLISKGSRKPNAKLKYLLNTLYEVSIEYGANKSIFRIINSNELKNYIRYDESLICAFTSIFYEIIYKSKEFCNRATYDNIIFLLEHINSSNYYLLGSIFMSHIMKIHGISPFVDGCVVCDEKKIVSIDNERGGFVCAKHCTSPSYDVQFLKNYRIICKCTINNYEQIKDMIVDYELFNSLCQFFIYNSDMKLKTLDFFARIK